MDRQPTITSEPKMETSFRVNYCPSVQDYYGATILPRKVVITQYVDRCKIVVSGPSSVGSQARSANFSLYGYQYPPPPEWLIEVVERARLSGKDKIDG